MPVIEFAQNSTLRVGTVLKLECDRKKLGKPHDGLDREKKTRKN